MHTPINPAPVRAPTLLSRIVRRIILAFWYVQGWKVVDPLPKHLKKYVLAGAPHTSNWDFVFFTGATHEEGVQPNFMGKHTLFKGVMKNFMLDMGGIPVDRRSRLIEEILNQGDASFTLYGGHNYQILEDDTIVYEYKTGPYEGQKLDKTFI